MHPSIKYSDGTLSPEEMNADTTYYLCPNSDCEGFFNDGRAECDHHCPWESDQRIIIKCFSCGTLIVLGGDHCSWCRVDCKCGASNFQRMSGRSHLLFAIKGPERKPTKTFAEKRCGRTWEKCPWEFTCEHGEECWYDSDDYYYDCGEGAAMTRGGVERRWGR